MSRLIFLCLILSACAKGPAEASNEASADPEPKVYDACTYSGSFNPQPTFVCSEVIILAADHPEIDPSYFAGADSLITREDFHQQISTCGPFHMPCSILVQGPGPKAIPELGL